jgi:hypothetical protein
VTKKSGGGKNRWLLIGPSSHVTGKVVGETVSHWPDSKECGQFWTLKFFGHHKFGGFDFAIGREEQNLFVP